MTVSPSEIQDAKFTERRRGYDTAQVDEFLARLSTKVAELVRERDELVARVAAAEQAAEEAGEAERLLRNTLVAAQRTAEQTVNEARASAEAALADARREAEEITAKSRHDADELIAQARARSEEQDRRTATIAAQVHNALEELRRFRSDYLDRVRALIAEQLAAVDALGDLPDLPPQLDDLKVVRVLEPAAGRTD